jgi:hypothetical protein
MAIIGWILEMVNTFTPLDHHSNTKELNKSLFLPHTRKFLWIYVEKSGF